MRLGIAVAAAVLTCAVVGCSSHTEGHGVPSQTNQVFDAKLMARDIQQQSAGSGTPLKNVVCPANETVRAGNQFDCVAAGDVKVHVKVTSDSGNYTWQPASTGQ